MDFSKCAVADAQLILRTRKVTNAAISKPGRMIVLALDAVSRKGLASRYVFAFVSYVILWLT